MEIQKFITSVTDPRRAEGKRYSFSAMMWMVFISIASGHTSYRTICAFCKVNKDFFMSNFDISMIPSHVTFFSLISSLDSADFGECFNKFMAETLEFGSDSWLSGDGQASRSTLVSSQSSSQSFCAVVSLFCQGTGLTLALKSYKSERKERRRIIYNFAVNIG